MSTRISRLEEKVEQLASLVDRLARELRQARGQMEPPEAGPGPAVGPGDYYGLYNILFDDWMRGNRRGVIRKFRSMSLDDLLKMAEAASLKVTERDNKVVLVRELSRLFREQEARTRALQYSGLFCLLQSEWNANNRPFVECRLNELSVAQLRDLAQGNAVQVSPRARRPGLIRAIEAHLEAHRTPLTEEDIGPRKYRDPTDEAMEYAHRVFFEEWNLGNCAYVYSQLENFDLDRLQRFIRVNRLPVSESDDRKRLIEEIGQHYARLKSEVKSDQYRGLYLLLSTEWRNNNFPFVNRRLQEMDQRKLAELADTIGVKTGKRTGKEALIRAIKDHLRAQAAG
ncbi:MAG: hypothetical protein N3E40_03405 [Dehalococcoidia bacterium]|nr:hypothetical protein [Dehalococcoidia bacterium]